MFNRPGITLLLVLLLVAVAVIFSACAPPSVQVVEKPVKETVVVKVEVTPTPLPPASKKGGTFVMELWGEPRSLNGIIGNDGSSLPVIGLNQNPLILGGENWGSVIEGDLVESWEVSEDGRVYTFHLRKDVKWHDGVPFTADDVIFTFRAIQDPASEAVSFRNRFLEDGAPIPFEKIDDYTVRATLKQPRASFLTEITVPIIPKHILEGQDIPTSPFNQEPIGTGPFEVVEWRAGESVILEANPDFYRGAPYLDRWVFRIIPDANARAVALQTGEIDFGRIDGKDVPRFLNKPEFTVLTRSVDLVRKVGINMSSPKFQDRRVRQALFHAIDRQGVIDSVVQGYGVIADSVFNQVVFVYKPGKLPQYAYDPEKAKALLAEAGWTDSDGDDILDKDGEPLEIAITYMGPWQLAANIAPVVQAYWRDIGIDATLNPLDQARIYEVLYENTDDIKEYDVFVSGWGFFGPEPDHYAQYFAPQKRGNSFFSYDNEQVRELFDKARVTTDQAERARLYEEAERLLWEDLPMLPLFYPLRIWVLNNRVNIDEAILDPTRFPEFRYPEKLYIQQK